MLLVRLKLHKINCCFKRQPFNQLSIKVLVLSMMKSTLDLLMEGLLEYSTTGEWYA